MRINTRYHITKWYDHPESGRTQGGMTVDTPLSREDLRAMLRNTVMTNLTRETVFAFPGVTGLLNPYTFVDKDKNYIDPVLETEAEYETRMQQGLPVAGG